MRFYSKKLANRRNDFQFNSILKFKNQKLFLYQPFIYFQQTFDRSVYYPFSRLSLLGSSLSLKHLLNNYWMRLSMISWIIKTEVWVICRSRRLRKITQTRGFDDSWYHAKTEFNNCFIIHFSHNSSSETEAKRSAILFLRTTLQGPSNQADVELDMINVISAADIAFIMSSSQAIVNWLNALDQSDFS